MQIRNAVVEYSLEESAAMLDISSEVLRWAVNAGHLQCYYQRGKVYWFHEASIRANKELLSLEDYLTELLSEYTLSEATTAPDAPEVDPPSKRSDP